MNTNTSDHLFFFFGSGGGDLLSEGEQGEQRSSRRRLTPGTRSPVKAREPELYMVPNLLCFFFLLKLSHQQCKMWVASRSRHPAEVEDSQALSCLLLSGVNYLPVIIAIPPSSHLFWGGISGLEHRWSAQHFLLSCFYGVTSILAACRGKDIRTPADQKNKTGRT